MSEELIGIGVVMIGIAAVLWAVGEILGTVMSYRTRANTVNGIKGVILEPAASLKLLLEHGSEHRRSHAPPPDKERGTVTTVDISKFSADERAAYIAGFPKETQDAIHDAGPGARLELCMEHELPRPCRICDSPPSDAEIQLRAKLEGK